MIAVKIERARRTETTTSFLKYLSATWHGGLERRFYREHHRKVDGSTPTLPSLLRPWIRCFTKTTFLSET